MDASANHAQTAAHALAKAVLGWAVRGAQATGAFLLRMVTVLWTPRLRAFLVALWCCHGCTQNLSGISPLAAAPDWSALKSLEGTITREQFLQQLTNVYAPHGAFERFVDVREQSFRVRTGDGWVELGFASQVDNRGGNGHAPVVTDDDQPLRGRVIALDPGHIGGNWARMEGRWFQSNGVVIAEGDLTLKVATHLKPRLEALGATVHLVRYTAEPLTNVRPQHLLLEADRSVRMKAGGLLDSFRLAVTQPRPDEIQQESERMFYRASELRARARLLTQLRPDVTVCMHFNAEPWGDDSKPTLVDMQHLHVLVNGAYTREELALQDVRADMVRRLLSNQHPVELALNESVARGLLNATALPPFRYQDSRAVRVGDSPYVWARNLLANRIYPGPVVYLEPFVMNSPEFVARVRAGDYEGVRWVGRREQRSVFREYADGVTEGLAAYFRRGAP